MSDFNLLIQAIHNKGLTESSVYNAIGVSLATWHRWKSGKVRKIKLSGRQEKILIELLDISEDELYIALNRCE